MPIYCKLSKNLEDLHLFGLILSTKYTVFTRDAHWRHLLQDSLAWYAKPQWLGMELTGLDSVMGKAPESLAVEPENTFWVCTNQGNHGVPRILPSTQLSPTAQFAKLLFFLPTANAVLKLRCYESCTASLITTMSAKIHEPPSGAKERKVLVRDTGFPEPLCSGAT